MPKQENKYVLLAGSIFLTVLGFILSMVALLLALKFLLGLLSYIPWLTYVYILAILLFPGSLFLSVYFIFWRKTSYHPSIPVRYISRVLFLLAAASWIYVLVSDMRLFFSKGYADIMYYDSFSLLFLSAQGALIFFIGILQALTTEKEVDWMDRNAGFADKETTLD